jgi:uncharacterized protein (DUF983 family)
MGEQPQCGQCGFAYRTAPKRGLPLAATLLIALAVVTVIALLAWKFLLGRS